MPAPPGNDLNSVFPDRRLNCIEVCSGPGQILSPMQNTFDCRFPHNCRVTHRESISTGKRATGLGQTGCKGTRVQLEQRLLSQKQPRSCASQTSCPIPSEKNTLCEAAFARSPSGRKRLFPAPWSQHTSGTSPCETRTRTGQAGKCRISSLVLVRRRPCIG